MTYQTVVSFWFDEINQTQWWKKDEAFDRQLRERFGEIHKAIIDRFGRYPHRNKILGRESTPAELAFLKEPGSSF